jgi:hypothetical protein
MAVNFPFAPPFSSSLAAAQQNERQAAEFIGLLIEDAPNA